MPEALQAIWYRERRPPAALRALACVFGLIVQLRRAVYARGLLASHRLARPVIIVGNLTVGGTGKTPLVIWLCEQLRALGLAPGVVMRGYGGDGGHRSAPRLVGLTDDAGGVGDEPVLLAQRTGALVVVCHDRVRAARLAIERGADVIVSDDGLQHLALARDFEIAVVDARRAFGNGYLLPAGPLREPAERLAWVDAVVLNVDGLSGTSAAGAAQSGFVMELTGEQLCPLMQGDPIALTSLAGARAHALAGIGQPERFFALLRAAGLRVIEHPFPDHHRYRASDLDFGDGLPVLMTEKDAVKCRAFGGANRWFVPVRARFGDSDAATLMARIRARVALASAAAPAPALHA